MTKHIDRPRLTGNPLPPAGPEVCSAARCCPPHSWDCHRTDEARSSIRRVDLHQMRRDQRRPHRGTATLNHLDRGPGRLPRPAPQRSDKRHARRLHPRKRQRARSRRGSRQALLPGKRGHRTQVPRSWIGSGAARRSRDQFPPGAASTSRSSAARAPAARAPAGTTSTGHVAM